MKRLMCTVIRRMRRRGLGAESVHVNSMWMWTEHKHNALLQYRRSPAAHVCHVEISWGPLTRSCDTKMATSTRHSLAHTHMFHAVVTLADLSCQRVSVLLKCMLELSAISLPVIKEMFPQHPKFLEYFKTVSVGGCLLNIFLLFMMFKDPSQGHFNNQSLQTG